MVDGVLCINKIFHSFFFDFNELIYSIEESIIEHRHIEDQTIRTPF